MPPPSFQLPLWTETIKTKDMKGTPRLLYIKQRVVEEISKHPTPRFAAIEGPALHATNRADDLGQLRGVLLVTLEELKIETLVIPPTTLKKFATGHGMATKEKIQQAAFNVWGRQLTEDEADAAWLSFIAYAHFSPDPLHALKRVQEEVLYGIKNPKARRATVQTYRTNNI